MLTGLPPFYDQDDKRMLEKIRYKPLQFQPGMSRPAKNLLSGLLTRDPETRLGSGPTDAEEIKVRDFFSAIDWKKLATGNMSPPWMPPVHGAADTSQFDRAFTTMPISSPLSHQPLLRMTPPGGNHFLGFSYTNPLFHYGTAVP